MNRNINNFDYILFLTTLLLSIIGIMFIYSSGINSEGILTSNEYKKQIVWASVGLILLVIVALYDYQKIKDRTLLIYIGGIGLLLYTVFFGKYSHGARSWIGIGDLGIQPSEFVKIVYILYMAFYLDRSQNETPFKRFVKAGIISLIPTLLILAQPDMGTATVYIPIFLVMSFLAGIPVKYIAFVILALLGTLLCILFPMWESLIAHRTSIISKIFTNTSYSLILFITFFSATAVSILGYYLFKKKYYYWLSYTMSIIATSIGASIAGLKVLKEYQMMRLIVFLNPEVDALGSGWNITQSILAIGSGGLKGRGFLGGTQSHYKFLPEQSTDFIFSILSEEWGFIGGLAVFGFYALIFFRIIAILKHTEDMYGKLICIGILTMFFFHFVVNVGMVMGIMPVMGIPLLLLSYGGSSLWTSMIAIGILLGIKLRQI
ncbi:MAG: rod shape-determining protein RodA [Treponema sp.]|nr:MAG: rod shape-determining protein RodA [Treponema sp.]